MYLRITGVILLALISACNKASPSRVAVTENVPELVELLHSLEPWKANEEYTQNGWHRMRVVSQRFARSEATEITQALSRFVTEASEEPFNDEYESESKAFLLLRCLFVFPERVPSKERRSFKGWHNWPDPDADGTVDPAWPVAFTAGKPALLDSCTGSSGPPYDAAREFEYFRERYKVRTEWWD